MASTLTLQNSINWALPFLNYAPVTIGTSSEPAITSANTILQTILAPPFKWRWNRKTLTFATVAGQQDYSVATTDFGFFELGSVAQSGARTFPLEFKDSMSEAAATEISRPEFIATQLDDDAGNITFRLLPVPDAVYTATVTYQIKPTLFTAVSGLWSPIPDFYSYVYNWGFLSLMSDFVDQDKAARYRQMFVASLIGVSEGLSESDKNLFISSWLGETKQIASNDLNTRSGWQGRTL